MRTFHTGGVAGIDITSGLPRVEELFEARIPKSQAVMAEIDGTVRISDDGDTRKLLVTSTEFYSDAYEIPKDAEMQVRHNTQVEQGAVLATLKAKAPKKTKKSEETALTEPNWVA